MSTLDESRRAAFGERLFEIVNHSGLALMISVGHRTGLLDHMAPLGSVTSVDLAAAAGLSERYVREWLGAMATGQIVEHDPATKTYRLPAEHAAWVTSSAEANVAISMQWVAVLGGVETKVVEAFQHGQGVPYEAYDRFHEVMADENQQSVVAALFDHILPLAPGLIERLEQGIDVLDIGCESGRAICTLAERFPRSRFTGYDGSPEAIAAAMAEAQRRRLSNVRFHVQDVATFHEGAAYDLVTAFDAIHDQAQPAAVLRNITHALRPKGVYLMQDISGSGHVHHDQQHPFGPFLYTISCMHCMSVSLAGGGPGLGAMWGKELAVKMLGEAGFTEIRVECLPHDPMNFYYLAGPPIA